MNKMVDFCDEKLYVRLYIYLWRICKKIKREGNRVLFRKPWSPIGFCWTCAYLSLIFIKLLQFQIVLKATPTLNVLIFFQKMFVWCLVWNIPCPIFLPDSLSGPNKLYSGLSLVSNEKGIANPFNNFVVNITSISKI